MGLLSTLRLALRAALALVLLVGACATRSANASIGAIEATQAATRLLESKQVGGISPSRVELFSTPDNPCLMHNPDPAHASRVGEVRRALADRRYYLVMYDFPNLVFGSTICVFVDETDGTVIEFGQF